MLTVLLQYQIHSYYDGLIVQQWHKVLCNKEANQNLRMSIFKLDSSMIKNTDGIIIIKPLEC